MPRSGVEINLSTAFLSKEGLSIHVQYVTSEM